MAKKQEVRRVPNLRFPGFEGEWETKKLGEISTFSKGKGISKSDIEENGITECIRYGELYTHYREVINEIKSKTNVNTSTLVLSEKNDVVIPASGETAIDIATASCVLKSGIALGGDLNIIKTNNNGVFLSYYLNSKKKMEIANLAQGISVVHLYSSQLASLSLSLPKFNEQNRISSFLALLDERIATQSKIIRELETSKANFLENIYSCKLRFKDATGADFPNWESRRLDTFIYKFIVPMRDKPKTFDGEIPWCRIEDFDGRYLSSSKSGQGVTKQIVDAMNLKIFPINTLLVSCSASLGFCAITKQELITNQTFIGLVPNELKVNVEFLYYVMKLSAKKLNMLSSGTTISYLSREQFEKFEIKLPSLQEQNRIANFLTSLDDKISVEQKLLEKLNQQKKYLLSNLFI